MAWQQSDLDKLDGAIAAGVQQVTYADGRSIRYQSGADMLAARREIKTELQAAASQVAPRVRSVVGRMRRSYR